MQKKIIALALAGLASSAAFAQTNVTIYGRMDYGYMVRGDQSGASSVRDNKAEFASGIGAGSRIGFKGTEDLGNGLKAIFQAEFGTAMDSSSGLNSTRNAYVGLAGNFGTVVGGRLDGVRYGIFNKYDAFAGGNIGNFTQMTAQVDRANNAIAYISPTFLGGLSATVAYATHIGDSNPLGLTAQEGGAASAVRFGNDGDAELNTVMLNYANGPLSVTLDYETVDFKGGSVLAGSTALTTDQVTVYTGGISYDFGVVKVAGLYDVLKLKDSDGGYGLDTDSWFISASAPLGKFLVKATYGETENDRYTTPAARSNKSAKIGLGVDYNLSKRTKIYAGYAVINNNQGSSAMLSPAANCSTASCSYGTQGYDLGVAHTF